jgi:hypothetical protein
MNEVLNMLNQNIISLIFRINLREEGSRTDWTSKCHCGQLHPLCLSGVISF